MWKPVKGKCPVRWIKTTIAEPFPVFYGHVGQVEVRAGLAEGPHYVAGSSFWSPFDDTNWKFREWQRENLARNGYTVTNEVVTI